MTVDTFICYRVSHRTLFYIYSIVIYLKLAYLPKLPSVSTPEEEVWVKSFRCARVTRTREIYVLAPQTKFPITEMTAVLRLWSRQSSKRGVRGYLSFSLKQVIIIRMFVFAWQGPGAVVVLFHVVRVRLPAGRGSRAARWMFGLVPRCSFGLLKFALF